MANNDNSKKPNTKNPILIFIIVGIIAIFLFKLLSPDDSSLFGRLGTNSTSQTIEYSEFKQYIKNGQIQSVSIGQTMIKGVSKSSNPTIYYTTRKVQDTTLIPLLDEYKVSYSGFSEQNFLTDMLGWLMPVLIIMAIWIFLNGPKKHMPRCRQRLR